MVKYNYYTLCAFGVNSYSQITIFSNFGNNNYIYLTIVNIFLCELELKPRN